MNKWVISVRSHTSRKDFMFTQKKDETPVQLYQRVKKQKQALEEKLKGQPVVVELISHSQAFKPPKDWKPPRKIATGRGRNWCPYCIKFRLMYWDDQLGVYRCPICGLSEADYHFKAYNGLFDYEREDWLIHKKSEKEKK